MTTMAMATTTATTTTKLMYENDGNEFPAHLSNQIAETPFKMMAMAHVPTTVR